MLQSAFDPKEDFAAVDRFFERVVQQRTQRPDQPSASARRYAAIASPPSALPFQSYASATASFGHAQPIAPVDAGNSSWRHPSSELAGSGRVAAGFSPNASAYPRSSSSYMRPSSGFTPATASSFVPPPIRTLAEFTAVDFSSGGGDGGHSPDSTGGAAISPSAGGRSPVASLPHSRHSSGGSGARIDSYQFPHAPSVSPSRSLLAPRPPPAAHAVHHATALDALTQQRPTGGTRW